MASESRPTWRMFVALLVVMFLTWIIATAVAVEFHNTQQELHAAQEQILEQQAAGRERGFINRAVGCMDIINDGEIGLTNECVDPQIAAYYPPDICERLVEIPEFVARECGAMVAEVYEPNPKELTP